MSPEQLEQKPYNHKVTNIHDININPKFVVFKVDIYSLGLIFLELLAPTTTGMERIMVEKKHIGLKRALILPLSYDQVLSDARRSDFPKELGGSPELLLLQDMLHKNPEVMH